MADAVRELITKVRFVVDQGSISKVNAAISKLKSAMSSLSGKAASVRVNSTVDFSGINQMKAALHQLNGKAASVKIRSTVDMSGINKMKTELGRLNGKSASVKIHSTVDLTGINQMKTELRKLKVISAKIKIGSTADLAGINRMKAELSRLNGKAASVKISSSVDLSGITKMKTELSRLNGKAASVKVRSTVDLSGITRMKTELSRLNGKAASVKVRSTVDLSGITRMKTELSRLNGKAASVKISSVVDLSGINKMKTELHRLKRLSTSIKIRSTVDLSGINQMKTKLTQLKSLASSIKIGVTVNSSSINTAIRQAKKLRQALTPLNGKSIVIKLRIDGIAKALNDVNRLRSALQSLRHQNTIIRIRSTADLSGVIQMRNALNHLLHQNATVNIGALGGFGLGGGGLAGIAGMFGSYLTASQIRETADEMIGLDGKLRTISDSERQRLDVESELYVMGNKTGRSMSSLGDLYFKVARASKKMGFAMKDNLRVTETVSKALSVGGASAAEANSTILQLGQALGSGKLQGDELHALNENASILMEHIAEYFGTTVAGLREMGAQGKLTADEVMRAILAASEVTDKEFNATSMTFSQAVAVMKNSWDYFILGVEKKSTVFSTVAQAAAKAFESLGNQLNDFTFLMGTPEEGRMVTITEAETGEEKQISETDYYNQKAAQNPRMMATIKALKQIAEAVDELDGKLGNMDDQLAGYIETFLKIGAVVAPILAVIGVIDGLILLLSPVIGMISTVIGMLSTAGGYIAAAFRAALPILTAIWDALVIVITTIAYVTGTSVAAVVGAILAVIAVLALVIVYWDEIKQVAGAAWDWICQKGQEAVAIIQAIVESIKAFFDSLGIKVHEVADGIIQTADTAASNLTAFFSAAINSIKGFFSNLLGHAMGVLGTIGSAIDGLIRKAMEFLGFQSQMDGVNMDSVQRMWDHGMASYNSSSSTEQNYTFNVGSYTEAQEAYRQSRFYSQG